MLEVNAVYFILLAEGFGLLLIVLSIWLVVALIKSRRKTRAVTELAMRIKAQAEERQAKTEAFLLAVYRLEADELYNAIADIDRREMEYFRLLLDSLTEGKSEQVDSLDSSLDKVIESYKCLQPRIEEVDEEDEVVQELKSLRGENEQLREELSQAKNNVSNMLAEFGNMFGGGKDHELTMQEVHDKFAEMNAENDAGEEPPAESAAQK